MKLQCEKELSNIHYDDIAQHFVSRSSVKLPEVLAQLRKLFRPNIYGLSSYTLLDDYTLVGDVDQLKKREAEVKAVLKDLLSRLK